MFFGFLMVGIIGFIGGALCMYFFLTSYLMEDELDELKWRIVMKCHGDDAELLYELFEAIKNGDYEVMDTDDDSAPTTDETTEESMNDKIKDDRARTDSFKD